MNRFFLAAGLSLAMVTTAMAQDTGVDREARAQAHAERRAAFLTEQLALTPAQTLEVQAIMAAQQEARRDLHRRHREERRALAEQGTSELAQVLSTEQQAKFEQLQAERKARWQEKRRHGRRHHRH